jgi:hypothetical protein
LTVVLGIESAFSRTGWALVERDGPKERLIAHGKLEAVDAEVVAEFSGRMATGPLTIHTVVIEDGYPLETNVDTLKALCRLVGRWQQAFEALGVSTRLVREDVWQSAILLGLGGSSSPRAERKKAAQAWATVTFRETLGEDEADAAGVATYELRQRALRKRAMAGGD